MSILIIYKFIIMSLLKTIRRLWRNLTKTVVETGSGGMNNLPINYNTNNNNRNQDNEAYVLCTMDPNGRVRIAESQGNSIPNSSDVSDTESDRENSCLERIQAPPPYEEALLLPDIHNIGSTAQIVSGNQSPNL